LCIRDRHYTKLIFIIVAAGSLLGILAGARMGNVLAMIYMNFYRFPYLIHVLNPFSTLAVVLITAGSALTATFMAIRRAAALPPAEAMRPGPPAQYSMTVLDRLGMGSFISQPTRMIIRNIERRPVKSALTAIGIALSCAIVIGGTFFQDAIDFMLDAQFIASQREDMTVVFTEPASRKALYELRGLKGVYYSEAMRSVPVRLRFGHRSYRTVIQGIEPRGSLYMLLNRDMKPLALPPEGIILNDYLAGILGVSAGDFITVEALQGRRPVRSVYVAGLVRQYAGLSGFMDISALNRLMMEGNVISGAYITTDPRYRHELYKKLMDMPRVAGTLVTMDELNNFNETQAGIILFYTFIASLLAATIAFGVIYNSARISLSERSRELASLRVLGYTRGEISYILIGELALLTLASIPVGFVIGRFLSVYLAGAISSELFRIPHVIGRGTYSLAALVILASAFVSALIVRRKLDHLDLVEVLKAKE